MALTAWASVSVCKAIRTLVPVEPQIKWPNDVLINGLKVCGILVEQGDAVVVGIGLNVNVTRDQLDASSLAGASSLAIAAGREFEIDDVAQRLIESLNGMYDQLLTDATVLEARWAAGIGLVGQNVLLETIEGRQVSGQLTALTFSQVGCEIAAGESVSLTPEQVRQLIVDCA